MSVYRTVILGAEREKEKTVAIAQKASGSRIESALESVAAYIPSEVVSAYIAALGIFSPKENILKWVIYLICVILILILIYISARIAQKKGLPKQKNSYHVIQFLIGLVAFTTWVSAMPETPFLELTSYANQIGALLAVIFSLLMPRIAEMLDIKPRS